MIQTEIFDFLDEDWIPSNVVHHKSKGDIKRGMTAEEFDEWQARSYGYENVKIMYHTNYIKDKLCIIKYGNNCNRSKLK